MENDQVRSPRPSQTRRPSEGFTCLCGWMDIEMAKTLLTNLYPSKPASEHESPLGIQMQLVHEIGTVLNTKGRKKCG